jgi:hypothetical protein
MKKLSIIFFFLSFTYISMAQVAIGTSTPDASARLQIDANAATNAKGFLLPRVTATEKNSIVSPATGLIVYQTDGTQGFYYYDGSSWNLLTIASNAVPYTGATSAVNLGSYDLTVNGITVGTGAGNVSSNTASGYQALYSNTTGYGNIANGYQALYSNTIGLRNIASGYQALYSNTSGSLNVAIGYGSLQFKTTGDFNTALGYGAGSSFATGNNCTIIGYGAQASASSVSNQITLGNTSIASLRCNATTITALSDRRDKTDIIPIGEGLAFLKQLNPVSFTWNTRDKAKVGIKSAGFIAQELLALQKQSNIGDNLDLVSEDNPEKLEARYGNLLPVIVKAIQEESAEKDKKINELRLEKDKEILVLKIKSTEKDAEIDALKQRLDALEKRFNQMLTKSNK